MSHTRTIPESWQWKMLGEVAETSSGGTPRRSRAGYFGGSIPWVKIGDLNDDLVTATEETITDAGLAESSATVLPAGTLLIAMYGSIGKLGILGMEAATNQAICALQPRPSVSRDFLYWLLRSQRAELLHAGFGGTQANISQTFLRKLPVALPPRAEQDRIVAAIGGWMSELEIGLRSIDAAAAAVAGLRRAALQTSIADGDEMTVGDVVAAIEAGKSFKCQSRPASHDEWGVVKVSAMTWGAFNEDENKAILPGTKIDERWEIRPGDLLLSRANTTAYVGASVLVRDCRARLLLSDKSLRLRPADGILTEWLHAALSAPSTRAQISAMATGTKDSMRNISQAKLRSVRIRVPSRAAQGRMVADLNRELEALHRAAGELQQARKRSSALEHAILTGAMTGVLVDQDPSERSASGLLARTPERPSATVPELEGAAT